MNNQQILLAQKTNELNRLIFKADFEKELDQGGEHFVLRVGNKFCLITDLEGGELPTPTEIRVGVYDDGDNICDEEAFTIKEALVLIGKAKALLV